MNIRIEPRKTAVNVIEYLFAAILILNCNTIWTSYEGTSLNRFLKIAAVVITVLYILICLNTRVQLSTYKFIFLFAVVCAGYFLIYTAVVRYGVTNYLIFLVDALCIYIVVKLAESDGRITGILYKFENLVVILAVISLVFWLFGSILGVIHSSGIVYSAWTGEDSITEVPSYFNLYFETQTTEYGLIRNTGIFTEAPMYNFVLCIALLIELFARRSISKIRCGILLIAILTTVSITGWCITIVALFAYYFSRRSLTRTGEFLKAIVIPVALVAVFILLYILIAYRLDTGSGIIRLDDFKAGFKAWTTHIWFGCGHENYDYVKLFMSDFRSFNLGFSNSPTQILAQGGIFLTVPYLLFTYRWIKTGITEKNLPRILFFICFICLFTITVTSYTFLAIFLFMAYSAIGESRPVQEEVPAISYRRRRVIRGKFQIKFRYLGAKYYEGTHNVNGKEC